MALLAAVIAAGTTLALAIGALGLAGGAPAASRPSSSEPVPQTDASVPAAGVTMIGAPPEEPGAPGARRPGASAGGVEDSALVRYYVHPGIGRSKKAPGRRAGCRPALGSNETRSPGR